MMRFATSQAGALASDHMVDCPYCASVLCTRVERTGCGDFLRRLCGFYPWHCNTCKARFCAWKRNYKPVVIVLIFSLAGSACVIKPVADMSENQRAVDEAPAKELRKLAEEGNATAQNSLGLLYQAGRGVPQSYGQAKKWFEEAAKQGHPEAQVNLGTLYLHGDAPPQSTQMALFWFDRAAEQGNIAAFANLGALYAEAQGVPQDIIQAYTWFLLAAENGDEASAHSRDLLAVKMNPVQIAEAQERARAWKPTNKSVALKVTTSSHTDLTEDSSR